MHIWSASSVLLLCVALLGSASSACAAEGHIAFSGAVVEPTCAGSPTLAGSDAAPHRLVCRKTSSSAGQAYSQEVMEMGVANPHHDRLLDYFASYAPVAANGNPTARLVLRTYE